MRKMKDSDIEWVGQIPENWKVKPVYFYFSEGKNKNYALAEQNLLSLSYGNIIRKDINSNGGLLPASFNTYNIVETDDIIIRPTDLQNDKRSLRTGLVKEHGIITSAYIDLRPKKNINSRYYHYLLHSYDVLKVFYNMGNGVRQGLNYSEFSKLLVLEPSVEEQQAIASFLDSKCSEIDSLVTDIEKEIDTLEEYKKSVITEAVTKGLNPDVEMKDSGIEWIGCIPKEWRKTKLKTISSLITDGTHQTPTYVDSGVPFLSIKDVSSGKLDFSDVKYISQEEHNLLYSHAPIKKGDILFTRIGTLGVFVKVDVDIIFDIFVSLGLIKIGKTDKINVDYLVYYLSSSCVFEYIMLVRAGLGTAAAKFNLGDVGNTWLLLPSVSEQQSIADYLDTKCSEIDGLITDKKQQLELLKDYKKSLIYEYVTGKKEVPIA